MFGYLVLIRVTSGLGDILISIPVVMVSFKDGNKLWKQLEDGENIVFSISFTNEQADGKESYLEGLSYSFLKRVWSWIGDQHFETSGNASDTTAPKEGLENSLERRPSAQTALEIETVQGLWVEGKLGQLERLSVQSFLAHGHNYHLVVTTILDMCK